MLVKPKMKTLFIKQNKVSDATRLEKKNCWMLYVFLIPAIVSTFIFAYLPMFSNYIAFLDYDFNKGWFGFQSTFVGFENFKTFLSDSKFYSLMGRTFIYSQTMLLLSFPVPLVLALMLNEIRNDKFKKTVQTVSYIPHFVSWVTVAGLVYLFLTTDTSGLINNIMQFVNPDTPRVSYMQHSKNFLPILVITSIWKEAGWGTILYFAALSTIDQQLYEAAEVDGAGRWRRILHITLPGLKPTMCLLLIFAMGGLFSTNFDQIFNLQNRMIRMDTDTIGVYTYYSGIVGRRYSYAAAVGLFQGLIGFTLVMVTNKITKKLSDVGII